MGANSNIEWTHHTFNPWRGCTKVSPGCKHCYADTLSKRNPGTLGIWGKQGTRVVAVESYWRQPLAWNKTAALAGERARVFCASLADVFEGPETMPAASWQAVTAARLRLFGLIEQTPWLDWLLLTKRPEHIMGMVPMRWIDGLPDNVWIGTSVEDQERADERIPALLQVPARVRFLSCEPLLGPVDLGGVRLGRGYDAPPVGKESYDPLGNIYEGNELIGISFEPGIHWVIAGGESGGNARPMHPAWAQSLRDQCETAGVAFHFKQWGEYWPSGKAIAHAPAVFMGDEVLYRVGKKAAGRLLDGREWNEVPA